MEKVIEIKDMIVCNHIEMSSLTFGKGRCPAKAQKRKKRNETNKTLTSVEDTISSLPF